MTAVEAMRDKGLMAKALALKTPDGYARERLGMRLHPKQAAVLRDLFSRRKTRLAWFCANEVGKTSRVAVAAILYALEIMNARVQMTSGSDRQLKEQLVPSLKNQAVKFPGWDFLDRSIKVNGVNQFLAYAARDQGTFQGFHEESQVSGEARPQLILVDESAAVADEIIQAAEDRCNPTWLLFMGSPLDPTGMFYKMSRELSAYYSVHRLTKLECTSDKTWNSLTADGRGLTQMGTKKGEILGRRGSSALPSNEMGRGWLDPHDIARTIGKNCGIPLETALNIVLTGSHGGLIKDPMTLSSIFAEFSLFVESALLTLSEYQKCEENPPAPQGGTRHGFFDFAGGRAKNVAALRVGNKVWIEKAWVEPDEMAAVGQFVLILKKWEKEWGVLPEEVDGDGDGLGGPMVSRIQELGFPIVDFHGGAAPRFESQCFNAWSECWRKMAERIKTGDIILPRDEAFRGQMLGRKCKPFSGGLYKLESKEEMRARGLASPDEADAICGAVMPPRLMRSVSLVQNTAAPAGHYSEEQDQGGEGRRYFQ